MGEDDRSEGIRVLVSIEVRREGSFSGEKAGFGQLFNDLQPIAVEDPIPIVSLEEKRLFLGDGSAFLSGLPNCFTFVLV